MTREEAMEMLELTSSHYNIKDIDDKVDQLRKQYDPEYIPVDNYETIRHQDANKVKFNAIKESAEYLKELYKKDEIEEHNQRIIKGTDVLGPAGQGEYESDSDYSLRVKHDYEYIIIQQANELKQLKAQLKLNKPNEEVLGAVATKKAELDLSALNQPTINKENEQKQELNLDSVFNTYDKDIQKTSPLISPEIQNTLKNKNYFFDDEDEDSNKVEYTPLEENPNKTEYTPLDKDSNKVEYMPLKEDSTKKDSIANDLEDETYDVDFFPLDDKVDHDSLQYLNNNDIPDKDNNKLDDVFKKIIKGTTKLDSNKFKAYSSKAIQVTRNFVNNLKNNSYKWKFQQNMHKILGTPVAYFKNVGEKITAPFKNQEIIKNNLDGLSPEELDELTKEYNKNGLINFPDETKKAVEKKIIANNFANIDALNKHIDEERKALNYINYRIVELGKMIDNLHDNEEQKKVYVNLIEKQYKGMADRIKKLRVDEATLAKIENDDNQDNSVNFDQKSQDYQLYIAHKDHLDKLKQLESRSSEIKDDKLALTSYIEIEKESAELKQEEDNLLNKGQSL